MKHPGTETNFSIVFLLYDLRDVFNPFPLFFVKGENATLQYVLLGANDKFDIRSSGQIVVKANIDREEKNQYKFVVRSKLVTENF